MDGAPRVVSRGDCFLLLSRGAIPVAPTHKTPGQRPKPRSIDETNGLFWGLGAPLGHREEVVS